MIGLVARLWGRAGRLVHKLRGDAFVSVVLVCRRVGPADSGLRYPCTLEGPRWLRRRQVAAFTVRTAFASCVDRLVVVTDPQHVPIVVLEVPYDGPHAAGEVLTVKLERAT